MTTLGLTAPHPGQRCKPHWYQRALTRLRAVRDSRRQRKADTATRDDAYAATLHEINEEVISDRVAAEIRDALAAVERGEVVDLGDFTQYADGFNQPPAAVQPDQDMPGLEHLDEGQYSDDTHAFSRYVDGGQE